jgi:hypothetical protein
VSNSDPTSTASGGGVGFAGLLTVLFVALKLTGVITWSWWWVVSPIWIGFSLGLAGIGAILLFAYLLATRDERRAERRRGQSWR